MTKINKKYVSGEYAIFTGNGKYTRASNTHQNFTGELIGNRIYLIGGGYKVATANNIKYSVITGDEFQKELKKYQIGIDFLNKKVRLSSTREDIKINSIFWNNHQNKFEKVIKIEKWHKKSGSGKTTYFYRRLTTKSGVYSDYNNWELSNFNIKNWKKTDFKNWDEILQK